MGLGAVASGVFGGVEGLVDPVHELFGGFACVPGGVTDAAGLLLGHGAADPVEDVDGTVGSEVGEGEREFFTSQRARLSPARNCPRAVVAKARSRLSPAR